MKPELIVVVGLPGVGKSTLIKTNKVLFPEDYEVISTDAYIQRYADSVVSTYTDVFETVIGSATVVSQEAKKRYSECGTSVIIDQTNLGAKKRRRLIREFPDYRYTCVVVTCDDKVREERLAQRPDKVIPPGVMSRMINSYEEPRIEEGFDVIYYINTNKEN